MSGTRDVFSNSGLIGHFVISFRQMPAYLLDSISMVCTTKVGSGSQDTIEMMIALKSKFVFHENSPSFCEQAVQLSTMLRSLLQQVVKNFSKWLSTGFGSRFLDYIGRTAELCPALSSLSSYKR